MMITFAVHDVTSSSIRQSHVACFSHSLHGTHDFSHATDSYQCAWFTHFPHDLPFVEGFPLSDYVVNLLIPPGADYHYPDVAQSSVDAKLILPFSALNQDLLLIRSNFPIDGANCKDHFLLEPKTGMDSGPKSPNNKFVENGRKSQSESREKILVDNVKRKELHMHQYKKHHQSCPNSMIDGIEFFLFIVIFLQPFALFLFFFRSSPLNPFSHYILWFLHHFLHPRVSQVLGVFLSHFAPP